MMQRSFGFLLAAALLALLALPAGATQPGEILSDPALEARAREIGAELRCLVCQNQSIDDSNAPLAHDLRVIVRERLVAGDSDEQVIAFVVERYGDYVLLKPPFKTSTLLLWGAPLLALLGGGLIVVFVQRRRGANPEAAPELTAAEKQRLDQLIHPAPGKDGSA